MPLRYRHGFHSRLADLDALLRYSLGILLRYIIAETILHEQPISVCFFTSPQSSDYIFIEPFNDQRLVSEGFLKLLSRSSLLVVRTGRFFTLSRTAGYDRMFQHIADCPFFRKNAP